MAVHRKLTTVCAAFMLAIGTGWRRRSLVLGSVAVGALLLPAGLLSAAPITWSPGPTFNGPNGFQAIQTNGSLLEAANLGSSGPLTVDPGGVNVTFSPANKLNQGFFGSGSPGSTDANWNTIINQTDWNNTNVTLNGFLSGLTVGRSYQLQLFASDARGCCSGRTQFFHDGLGNNSPTFVQGTFTSTIGTFAADNANQAVGFNASSNNPILNAYVLRDVSPVIPITPGTFIDEDVEGNVNGWLGWGGNLSPPYLNLLPLAGDIDDPALSGATAVPDALNLLNNAVPFINGTAVTSKTYGGLAIEPGSYEFLIQVGNWNNAAFPNPTFDFNGLTPESIFAPVPASGDDEIWRFTYTVNPGDPAVGQAVNLTFQGTLGSGNYAVDHILGRFAPGIIPEPSTVVIWSLLAGLGIGAARRRRER